MKKILPTFLGLLLFLSTSSAQSGTSADRQKGKYKINWTVNPFDHKVFIENKGQFDTCINGADKVLFAVQQEPMFAYFTAHGLIYKYIERPKREEEAEGQDDKSHPHYVDPDLLPAPNPIVHELYAIWQGSSPSVIISGGEEQGDYYSYPTSKSSSIKVNIFKKITYLNLYPNIDVEYIFPKDKEGMKYTVIVHPGGDASLVKLTYSGAQNMQVDGGGNIQIKTGWGDFTDFAPHSYYKEDSDSVASSYQLNDSTESFVANNIRATKTFMIDPYVVNWTNTTLFTSSSASAYDLDYDNLGNVWVYGAGNPLQLSKFNSAGVKQWTYNNTAFTSYYGDFAIDKYDGNAYLTEGFNGSGARAEKVNTLGVLLATSPSVSSLEEMWRIAFDPCHRVFPVGGGGFSPVQVTVLDTTMAPSVPVNALSATAGQVTHDCNFIAIDPDGSNAYMAVAQSVALDPTNFINDHFKMALPTLIPTSFINSDGYNFQEVGSVLYPSQVANGMNGMAASPNWLYEYDGQTLKEFNKNTGIMNLSSAISGTSYNWGGLDVDYCDNVYAGNNNNIGVYNSALVLTSTIGPLTNTIYDVVLGSNYTTLYACGKGFLSSISITPLSPPVIQKTETPAGCSCTGTASATLLLCGNPVTTGVTYQWSTGQTTSSVTGLCAGVDSITITFGCGEVFKDTVNIPGTPGSLTLNTSNTNVACAVLGTATVTASGGASPYTYSWSPVTSTNSSVSGLSAGTYTVYVTDATGCTGSTTVIITSAGSVTLSITSVNATCSTLGSATVTASGGSSPYTYSWAPSGGSNSSASNLSAGTYTVFVTDANGCTGKDSVIITGSGALSLSMTSFNATCAVLGYATVTVTGGNSPYTYSWAPSGGSGTSATNLSAGTYTVFVTDVNGCTAKDSVIITGSGAISLSTTQVNSTCALAGSATVTATGGTSPFTYSWSPSAQTVSTATSLSAGTYTVYVTDINGCTSSTTVTITGTSPPFISMTNTNENCFGGTNASATATVTAGTAPYTYAWTPSGGNGSSASGLSIGTYTLTVTDAAGCSATVSVIISQPAVLSATISSSTNVLCNGGTTGSANANVSGGTSPYTYAWTPAGGNSSAASGLSAGTCTVNVTDANGCTASASVTITQPTALTATTLTVGVTCNGSGNGSASVTTGGGTSPYTYAWSPGGKTTAIISGLTAGTYTVTVTDNNGCTTTATAIVTEPPVITISFTNTNVNCTGGTNGSATATPSGGSAPYTYAWVPSGKTTASISNLSAGTYTVTVTDANNCSSTAYVIITQPPTPLSVRASATASVCSGAPTLLSSTASGGTGPYIYSWAPSGGPTDTTTVYPINPTTYTIYVTDANGCTASATVSIVVDPPLSISLTGDTSACPGSTIYLFVQGSGGDGNYKYKWVPSNSSTQWVSFTLTKDTTVTVELTDGCGSTMLTETINVNAAPFPNVAFTENPNIGCAPLCVQFRDLSSITSGSIVAWSWTFGDRDSSNSRNPIYCYKDTGTFIVTLTATSSNGCSNTLKKVDLVKVYSRPIAQFIYSPNPINILNPNVQFIDKSIGEYKIAFWWWNFGDGVGINTDQNPSHLYGDTGTYCVRLEIMDIHGCTDTVTNCLDVQPLYTFYIPNAFTPNGDDINDIFQPKGTYIRSYEMYIFDRWGMKLYHTTDFYTGWNGKVNNEGQPCQEDTYVYLFNVVDTQGNKHTYTGKVSLIR